MSAVVVELKKELAALNVSICNDEVGAFRSCLCAMAARLQSEEAAAALSLAEWWQWLDDEGYERELFAAALRHICQSSLSEPAWTELQSDVHCMQARSEGLPELCQHVQERSKTLASTMEHLEACAQAEQHALEMTAGGMSKKGALITAVSAYVGIKVIAAISVGLIVRRSKRLEVRIEPVLETAHQQAGEVEKKEEEEIFHTGQRTIEDVKHIGRADEREIENGVKSDLINKEFFAYSEAINAKFKEYVQSGDFGLKPLFTDAKGGEHYILKYHERDIVKAVVKGQEFIFYKSTGYGGKSWETQKWYPINGISKSWFNKVDGAQNYFGVRKLKLVNQELFELSRRDSFKAAERHLVEAETEAIRRKLNEGMNFVTELNDMPNYREMRRETFKKVLPMLFEENFPNLRIKSNWIDQLASKDEWHMRGLTEDPETLKKDFDKLNANLGGEDLRQNTNNFEHQVGSAKRRIAKLNQLSEEQLAKAKGRLVEDIESAVTTQITDHVVQLETAVIDTADQKVEAVVANKVAATVRNEESRLITATEIRGKRLVHEGELTMEKDMVIEKNAERKDVQFGEETERLLQ